MLVSRILRARERSVTCGEWLRWWTGLGFQAGPRKIIGNAAWR